MDFIVAKLLYLENPNQEEGFLSQKRAIIVGRKHLNLVGKKIFLDSDIKSNLKVIPKSVYGNTLESIIGAIYIDKGIEQANSLLLSVSIVQNLLKSFLIQTIRVSLLKISQKLKIKINIQGYKKRGP